MWCGVVGCTGSWGMWTGLITCGSTWGGTRLRFQNLWWIMMRIWSTVRWWIMDWRVIILESTVRPRWTLPRYLFTPWGVSPDDSFPRAACLLAWALISDVCVLLLFLMSSGRSSVTLFRISFKFVNIDCVFRGWLVNHMKVSLSLSLFCCFWKAPNSLNLWSDYLLVIRMRILELESTICLFSKFKSLETCKFKSLESVWKLCGAYKFEIHS